MTERTASRGAVDDLAVWLSGRWAIERTINDDQGRFTGVAAFTAQDGGATTWHETGRLRIGAHEGPAWRTLLLRPHDAARRLVGLLRRRAPLPRA